jgi:PhnB protein
MYTSDANHLFFDAFTPSFFCYLAVYLNNNLKIKTMAVINPHINFNGNAEEAFMFYKSVFGGEFTKVIRFKDLAGPEFPIAEKEANKIMHIALPIGKVNVLMGNDVPEILGTVNENENRSKIAISVDSKEEADQIFTGLSEGGAIEMPIQDSPWGSYFGMFRDKYGIEWMVEFAAK